MNIKNFLKVKLLCFATSSSHALRKPCSSMYFRVFLFFFLSVKTLVMTVMSHDGLFSVLTCFVPPGISFGKAEPTDFTVFSLVLFSLMGAIIQQ